MDVRKEYDKNEAKRKKEVAITRLEKPQHIHFYLPMFMAIIIVMYPIFDSHIPFAEFLKLQLNPVLIMAMVAVLIPGIKYDKNSKQLYQALCVPVESMNMEYIKSLIDTRHKNIQVILVISIIALVAAYFLMHINRNIISTQYACLLGTMINFLGDKKRLTEKIEEDIASLNAVEEQ
ncbi:MAG: hypothetical protein IKU54_02660 [Oscillospiraceae bacterium]|nr:hypothetical protein [Oscillospiraceae bacterium]